MAKVAKKLVDINPGDKYAVVKTVTSITKTMDEVQIIFDDGSTMKAAISSDPAIEIEK